MKRRTLLGAGVALPIIAWLPRRVHGADAQQVIAELLGDATPQRGKLTLDLPRVAENGNSVALTVNVDSPMSETDYVARIAIVAEKNPRPLVLDMRLMPAMGRAQIGTRIRLAGTQRVQGLAQLSDGSWWTAEQEVAVTNSACYDGS